MNLDDSQDEDIKSTAVVMYSVPKPAQFTKLKCNTDLNLPPSNWLSNSADSYGLQQVLYQHKGFSSFRMAHLFPDCVGEVDVVSDSENIKKLLNIPYNKGHISMMVHRVENTLLLDDFNIYKHLLRNAETEWEWLRKFFCENVESKVIEDEKTLYIKDKRIKALQQKCLNSKFLYHSLGQNIDDLKSQSSPSQSDNAARTPTNRRSGSIPAPNCDPLLPDPAPHQTGPKSSSSDQKYNRNVVWTFEDISMLIGTDLPIFGGGTHPCISLRLREMNQPINVLTGIDYWLDNLMSNVPELAMCYHLNGIVQKYELIKTEDLPSMENSKFSPKLIRDVAQSILSFLKSNATKAGHTYWLFKGKNEEVVKLYDLTSLCANDSADSNQNPFIVPVAMLLYRVARNMKHSNSKTCVPTIRMLLRNAIKLLDGEKHAEIVTSAHYMLSDVYVPSDTNPDEPESLLMDEQTDDDETEDERNSVDREYSFEEEGDSETSFGPTTSEKDDNVPMKVLSLTTSYSHQPTITRSDKRDSPTKQDHHKTPPPLPGTVEERCVQSIGHIAAGLNCLQYITDEKKDGRRNSDNDTRDCEKNAAEEHVCMANSSEAIPMPYSSLNKKEIVADECGKTVEKSDSNRALLLKSKGETQSYRIDIPWKAHLKRILYEKAILVYTTLSEHYFRNRNYGSSLRSLALLVRCLHIIAKLNNTPRTVEGNSIIASRAGDCCILITKNWVSTDEYSEQVHKHGDQDLHMLEQIQIDERRNEIDLSESPMKYVLIHDIRTLEQILLQALYCYQQAKLVDDSVQILKRLGNSYNELGSYYLNCAKSSSKSSDSSIASTVRHCCLQAEPYLHKGLEVFEHVRDESNIALLCSNIGHLHRMLVYCHVPKERGPLCTDEKVHFNKAIQYYKKALQVLGERKHNPKIWDAVNWELSSALFTLATILHEFPVDRTADNEKLVMETFQKVLQYCDFNASPELLPVYQMRAATVYYRLGCIHHKAICDATCSEQKRKRIIQLAKVNYNKGAKLFVKCADVLNLLTVQHQHWALVEYLVESSTALHMKLKLQQSALMILVSCREVIDLLVNKTVLLPPEDTQHFKCPQSPPLTSCCASLLILLKQRLQTTLKSLVKLCLNKPPIQKECTELLPKYKPMYSLSLSLEHEHDFQNFVTKLNSVLNDCACQICGE